MVLWHCEKGNESGFYEIELSLIAFTGVKRSRLGDGNHSTAETVVPFFQERLLGLGTTGL